MRNPFDEDAQPFAKELGDEVYCPYQQEEFEKLLERLSERGFVDRRRDGRANRFAARVAREELIRHRLRDAADKLCEGSMTPLLTQLMEARTMDAHEVQALRDLVTRLDNDGGKAHDADGSSS